MTFANDLPHETVRTFANAAVRKCTKNVQTSRRRDNRRMRCCSSGSRCTDCNVEHDAQSL